MRGAGFEAYRPAGETGGGGRGGGAGGRAGEEERVEPRPPRPRPESPHSSSEYSFVVIELKYWMSFSPLTNW